MNATLLKPMFAGVACLALSACASLDKPLRDPAYAPTYPAQAATAPAAVTGSIYNPGNNLFLWEDVKPRRVGDILTVVLEERTDANKSASTTTKKESSVGLSVPGLFGRPATAGGTEILNAEIEGARDFKGNGGSSQSNRLSGNITVTVSEVLPNGILVVRGEKLLTLNQGSEVVRVRGLVRPTDIRTDNSIRSWQIANAEITYSGKGALADSNQQGWLSRFFNSPMWPF